MELFETKTPMFPTLYSEILQRVRKIDPVKYGSSRNYLNGSVSYLSPYISRGIISTNFVFSELMERGFEPPRIQKFIQELAWRDYWQQVWISKQDEINEDIKHKQAPVANTSMPKAILDGKTGVEAIDESITRLYQTGYMHNHIRMYVASIACNIGQSHWTVPAKWMYYHLLDADWASNALSWQWVAGANANKKYVANQENINRYCFTNQKDTFLDVPYEAFEEMKIPEILQELSDLVLKTNLPKQEKIIVDEKLPSVIYNFYNIDPVWKKDLLTNRILLLEPSHFDQYPVSEKTIDFILKCAKENIVNIQIYVGEFDELVKAYNLKEVYYKEHPLNKNYKGIEESREWMFDVKGYYPSFFAFWKKCKKQLVY